jgi:Virulence-associated protein E
VKSPVPVNARAHVLKHLDGLVWDGEPRVDDLARTVNAEEPSPGAFRRFFRNAVARAYESDRLRARNSTTFELDSARHLVLLGPFGTGKTALVRSLVPVGWFASLWFHEAAADRDGVLREPYVEDVTREREPGSVAFTGVSLDFRPSVLFDVVWMANGVHLGNWVPDQLWAEAVVEYKARRAVELRVVKNEETMTEAIAKGFATKADGSLVEAYQKVLRSILAGEQLAEPGNRFNAINRACSFLVWALPREATWLWAKTLIGPCIAACDTSPEGIEYYFQVAEASFARALERRKSICDVVAAHVDEKAARS